MSSVLHPVGPEQPQTYWIRRLLVLASSILVLVLLIAVIVSANKPDSAVATGPTSQPTALPSDTATPTADQLTPSLNVSADTRTVAPASKASPAATSNASPAATSKASPDVRKSTATPSPSATPTKAGAVDCDPATLRTTLTGRQLLKAKSANTFTLSVINGGPATCTVNVSPATFVLTIYSGRDRIWTTADCGAAVKPIVKRVASQAAVEWQLRWDGRRSLNGCKQRPEIPRAGTYVATAELQGAKPVRLRMVLRG